MTMTTENFHCYWRIGKAGAFLTGSWSRLNQRHVKNISTKEDEREVHSSHKKRLHHFLTLLPCFCFTIMSPAFSKPTGDRYVTNIYVGEHHPITAGSSCSDVSDDENVRDRIDAVKTFAEGLKAISVRNFKIIQGELNALKSRMADLQTLSEAEDDSDDSDYEENEKKTIAPKKIVSKMASTPNLTTPLRNDEAIKTFESPDSVMTRLESEMIEIKEAIENLNVAVAKYNSMTAAAGTATKTGETKSEAKKRRAIQASKRRAAAEREGFDGWCPEPTPRNTDDKKKILQKKKENAEINALRAAREAALQATLMVNTNVNPTETPALFTPVGVVNAEGMAAGGTTATPALVDGETRTTGGEESPVVVNSLVKED